MPESKAYIVSDQPTEKDALNFKRYVDMLVDVCQTSGTPLTIGVFGTWGSGKTSLMHMVKNGLPSEFTIAWFDAWKYDKEETLWRAFLLSVLSAIRTLTKEDDLTEDLDYLQMLLYQAIDIERSSGVTIDLLKLGSKVAQGAVQIGLSFIPGAEAMGKIIEELQKAGTGNISEGALDAIRRERSKVHIEQVRFLEQFQDKFRLIIEQHVTNNGGRLVVFVDDLDRCLPEKAIEVLEAIKLFFDVPGCVFVLGLDQEIIARGIEIKYKELGQKRDGDNQQHFTIQGIRYLEKIIQLPFQIPPIERAVMGNFVHSLSKTWPHDECPRVFSDVLGDNPRQVKRTVNMFLMLWKLADENKAKFEESIKPIRLAKIVAIQAIYPELYDLLKEEPRYLRDLEEYYRGEFSTTNQEPNTSRKKRSTSETITASDFSETVGSSKIELPPALTNFIGRSAIRRILMLHPIEMNEANFIGLKPDELKPYFTLTRRAEVVQVATSETPQLVFEPQLVRISAGEFLMGSTQEQAKQAIKDGLKKEWANWEQPQRTVELSDYSIGKYPITNREYQAFVKDINYSPPSGWNSDQYPSEKGDHPVVNVSWEDATNYCKWLSEKTQKKFRLPTEAEWEKAARGTAGFIWPWGNEFGEENANTAEMKIDDTTAVDQFSPRGNSPYGCADMIGNVWEWCADWFDENQNKNHPVELKGMEKKGKNRLAEVNKDPQGPNKGFYRVLRGGSFYNLSWCSRCAYRSGSYPYYFFNLIGFRVALSGERK